MRISQRKLVFALVAACLCAVIARAHAGPQMVLQSGHLGEVLAVAFSPDGKILASGGRDGTIRLWNVRSGETVAILSAHEGNVQTLAFSRDGRRMASGGDDATIKLWNVQSATLQRSLSGHKQAVRSVAWSPDGKSIASGSHDATAKLWDAQSGQLKQTFADAKQRATWVNSVAWSPDGKQLAVCGAAYQWGLTSVWDLTTKRLKYELSSYKAKPRNIEELENNCVAWSPDGNLLATATRGGVVKMWNARTGKLRYALTDINEGPAQATRLLQLKFSPDSSSFAATSTERNIKLWDAATGELYERVGALESNGEISDVAWSPDGTILAATDANSIRLASVKSGMRIKKFAGNEAFAITSVAFSKDGKFLASGGEGQPLVVWNAQTATPQRVSNPGAWFRFDINSLAFSPDARIVALGVGGSVRLWSVASGQITRTLADAGGIYDVAWSPDGNTLAAATGFDEKGSVRLWNAHSGKLLHTLSSAGLRSVAWSPDGKLVAGGEEKFHGAVLVWRVADGKLVQTLKVERSYISSVAFSSDGKRLLSVTGSDYPALDLWNLETGAKERSFAAGIEGAFSPDGKIIAGAAPYHDGKSTIRLWEAQSGVLRGTLKGHGGFVRALQFRPDNQILVSGGEDGKIIFWDVARAKPLLTLLWLVRTVNVQTAAGWRHSVKRDWIAYTPEGYYNGSKDCEKYIRWRVGDKLFPAAKYAAQFHRADLVKRALKISR